jgi:HNH endonuclease
MIHHNLNQFGSKNPNWKGGRVIDSHGYVRRLNPNHPFHDNHGYVREHRLIWEQHYNAILLPWADVHHKDKNRQNNSILNLDAMTTSQHMILEHTKDMSDRRCFECGSDKTSHWRRNPYVSELWTCDYCYQKLIRIR